MTGKLKLQELVRKLRGYLRRGQDGEDSDPKVRVPRKKGPGSLSAAVALKEPRD